MIKTKSKMKTIVLLTLLIVIPFFKILGQEKQSNDSTKSIEQEILQHQESELSLLNKSRALLLDAIRNNDTAKAGKVLSYMKNKFDSSRVVILFSTEKIFVDYWLHDYDDIFSIARNPEFGIDVYKNKLLPPRDLLFNDLKSISQRDVIRLDKELRFQSLPQYKKRFSIFAA